MAAAVAAYNTHQSLGFVNAGGIKYFMEKLLLQIYEYFDEQDLTDVTFKLSNPNMHIPAHRLILAAASPYFKELFKSDKGICPFIEITEIDSDTFERLITYCYTGQTLITIDNVDRMLKAAIILQLNDAMANCVEFIIQNMTVYTLQRAYALESETQNTLLSQKIIEYEIRNFMDVIQSTEFLNFEADKLQQIVECDTLNVTCEADVFEAVKRWYEHDAAVRNKHLPDLIGSLRLTQFDASFITSNILPLPGCRALAFEAIAWSSVPPSMRATMQLNHTQIRTVQRELLTEQKLLAAFFMDRGCIIYQYDRIINAWEKWYNIKECPDFSGLIYMNENLIFIGGEEYGESSSSVRSWNIKTKVFDCMPPMKQDRNNHSVVMLNDKIYAIGGRTTSLRSKGGQEKRHDEVLQSVEMYSVSNGWVPIKRMNIPRCFAAAVTLNGKIYVMGGYKEVSSQSAECYDPATNSWTRCADMNEAHYFPGAAVHNGQIYVVGGRNSSSVERYNPQGDVWTKISSLENGRCGAECISFDGQLWAIGGYKKDCVSVYDDEEDFWTEKLPMPFESVYYCFTAPDVLLRMD